MKKRRYKPEEERIQHLEVLVQADVNNELLEQLVHGCTEEKIEVNMTCQTNATVEHQEAKEMETRKEREKKKLYFEPIPN